MRKILVTMFETSTPPIIATNPPIPTPAKQLIIDCAQWFEFMEISPISKFADLWSSLKTPVENYLPSKQTTALIQGGYSYEVGPESTSHDTDLNDYTIINTDDDFPCYTKYFYHNSAVKHYFDKTNNQIVSCIKDSTFMKTYVRSEEGIIRCVIQSEDSAVKSEEVFHGSTQIERMSNDFDIDEDLMRFHASMAITKYRFGVVYVGPGQYQENEIFANDNPSPAFWKFMDLIAKKEKLKGYDRYAGGLDTKGDVTGTHSFAIQFESYDCMFHVAPMIPREPKDEQSLERKRFVGNDVVVIVFKEQLNKDDVFVPSNISSHFTHVFIIVTPNLTTENNESYTISIASKDCVKPFPPFLRPTRTHPILPVLPHDSMTRQFIMRKLINGERTALKSKVFAANSKRVFQSQIKQLFDKYAK
ncbi:rap GTPase-activating protein, putative [Entamoeba invadens IP1]|uniref:Rap GTPase-activating protein, putative n=1 Tax=Entamoeba invadens IP1 TaxID=370355 RepID=A0A0A1U343_ENTIV|nr:rap GTPase-activating protein, putative [Entamoeba invadens IP1]ELP88444.1 rap GTPase-activating protein, putative [Entamoeba invadens IP1]|eukprot:XP_004255215.1 rap GTPase-activating protein, putative [Entamoeba invadens IP1]